MSSSNGYFSSYSGYKETTSGYSKAHKNKEISSPQHKAHNSIFTQPVHFPQTDPQHLQQNFADLFCSEFTLTWHCFHFLLRQPSNFDFVNHQIVCWNICSAIKFLSAAELPLVFCLGSRQVTSFFSGAVWQDESK